MAVYYDEMDKKAEDKEVSGLHLVDEDSMKPKFIGQITDTIKFVKDGIYKVTEDLTVTAKAGDVLELPVGYNTVVNEASKLIAALIKRHTGYQGALQWEVGSGQSTWDDANPPAPNVTDKALATPFFRKAIQLSDISFIDGANAVVSTVTNRIQIKVTFLSTEANGYLREFGIFGGGADCKVDVLGSGHMINRKTHGVIFKTSGMEITRTLRFTF